ncbi:PLC-like phosphodiesterase [Phyllosticta capitalensis]|uniref:PLC-like phosphodiesterase n=1 Tax=Phyllosticta capitalensis TaxID=121624 RepID=A0ABR1YKJ7_9PEZI
MMLDGFAEGWYPSLRLRTTVGETITLPSWHRLLMESSSETQPLLSSSSSDRVTTAEAPPPADFTFAQRDKHGRAVPQCIAHRGFKARYPENSMAAFAGAVQAGAQALETDVHLSRDGAVVLSHDPSLQRCFGKKEKIIDCEWSYLETLRTVAEPHEPLPRLRDLLEYLTTQGTEDVWVLLDIKRDNNLDDVFRLIAAEIASVPPAPSGKPWNQRIVLGIWAANYLPPISQYLPHYPLTYITFSLPCATKFLHSLPGISFNMYAPSLVGPVGARFRAQARKLHRPVYDWTVNKESLMKWSIDAGLDGVVTDEVERFVRVRDTWGGGGSDAGGEGEGAAAGKKNKSASSQSEVWRWGGWTWGQVVDIVRLQVVLFLLTPILWWWMRPWGALDKVAKGKRESAGRRQ